MCQAPLLLPLLHSSWLSLGVLVGVVESNRWMPIHTHTLSHTLSLLPRSWEHNENVLLEKDLVWEQKDVVERLVPSFVCPCFLFVRD